MSREEPRPGRARGASRFADAWAVATLLAVALFVGCVTLISRESLTSERQITDRPVQVAEDGYATSESCRPCHPSQYDSWRESYHRTMTQVATPDAVVADFDGVQVNEAHGKPMVLEIGR